MFRLRKKKADELTLVGHLAELRWRILASFLALVGGTAVGFTFSERLLQAILAVPGELVYLAPGEAFFTHLRLAVITGVFLAMPMILYQACAFVLPGLSRVERRYLYAGVPMALILFFLGALFAYRMIIPLTYTFFLGFGSDSLTALISVASYFSFVISLVLPFGLVFQLPLLMMILTGIGLVTPAFLKRNRKFAILTIFVLAALLTPPDIISQVFMAGPLLALYELSIVMSRVVYWRRRRAESLPGS
jgi:sec-independent protein translocase protein TatC